MNTKTANTQINFPHFFHYLQILFALASVSSLLPAHKKYFAYESLKISFSSPCITSFFQIMSQVFKITTNCVETTDTFLSHTSQN